MAEAQLRREAAIYEMAMTARAQERSRELLARADALRQPRERLP